MRKNQKGFTLVELLVVIAILAILATVAVVGYSSFIDSANKSVDQQVVAQMNTALQAASVEGRPQNRTDLLKLFDKHDIDINKLAPVTEGYAFYWDMTENKIVIVNNVKDIEEDWEYIVSNGFGKLTEAESVEYITSAISESSKTNPALIKLSGDVTTTECITVTEEQCVIIDLNGHTIGYENSDKLALQVEKDATLTVKNGDIKGKVNNVGGHLTLDHVNVNKEADSEVKGALAFSRASDTYITNCTFTADKNAGHTIGTNSTYDADDGARVYIIDSKIYQTSDETYPAAALNITIDCDITINHCKVIGVGHGAYFRGCTATLINSTFTHTSTKDGTPWGTGNNGKFADIVFACGGENFSGYATTANYTCEKVTATTVYVHQPEGGTVTVSGIEVNETYN